MNHSTKFVLFVLFFPVLFFCTSSLCKDLEMTYASGTTAISGQVFDADTGSPLPARIVVLTEKDQALGSYYNSYPGFFTDDNGTFSLDAAPGNYTFKVYRGIDYLSQTHKIKVEQDKVLQLVLNLKPWVPLRKLGWVNGDGHAHLRRD